MNGSTDHQNSIGQKLLNTLTFFASVALFVFLLNWSFGLLPSQEDPLPDEVIAPTNDESPLQEIVAINIHNKELLSSPYEPPKQPFSKDEYAKMPFIVYSGTFSGAILHIKGSVTSEGAHYLMFNFNNVTGIINGARSAANRLDVKKTKELGGFFSDNIESHINLMNATLGTSSKTYLETGGKGIESYRFIHNENPVSVAHLFVIPVSHSGQYGGGVIDSLELEYWCSSENTCKVHPCKAGQLETECIKENYDDKTMKDWRLRTGT